MFELARTQSGYAYSIVHDFLPIQNTPSTVLYRDTSGALYGAAAFTLFQFVPPSGSGTKWTEHELYAFKGGISGTQPGSALVADAHGDLFGSTVPSGIEGFGTVFELKPPGPTNVHWDATTLAKFTGGLSSVQPFGGVVFGSHGMLYGAVSELGGGGQPGFIYSLAATQSKAGPAPTTRF